VVLKSQANFAWITAGGRSHISIGAEAGVASVLVTADTAALITTNIELSRLLEEEAPELGFEGIEYPWEQQDGLISSLARVCDPKRCAADLPSDDLGSVDDAFLELRRVLRTPEIARYRDLGSDSALCVGNACRAAQAGESEQDVAARVASECEKRDILPLVDLVATDERIASYRHPLPTTKRLGQTLLVALTGRRHGLHASLTRMVTFGAADSDLVARHQAVTRVDTRTIVESRPGKSLGDVMLQEMNQYELEGFPDEWRLHHQGGLTGYAGREVFASPSSSYRLKPNQALAWNPSITRVKSEDTILITDDGYEILTRDAEWPHEEVKLAQGSVERPSLLMKGDR
jgi:Xaa-Pro aminopeptidase